MTGDLGKDGTFFRALMIGCFRTLLLADGTDFGTVVSVGVDTLVPVGAVLAGTRELRLRRLRSPIAGYVLT